MKTIFFNVLSCAIILTLGSLFLLPSDADAQERKFKRTTGETPNYEVIICDGSGNDCTSSGTTVKPKKATIEN